MQAWCGGPGGKLESQFADEPPVKYILCTAGRDDSYGWAPEMMSSGGISRAVDIHFCPSLTHCHMLSALQGTMTHMAPEIMLDGRISKAADVYAFGITLWEMYTGGRAFEGVPKALLGHQISREHQRPKFPDRTPRAYQQLAERCWQPDWESR